MRHPGLRPEDYRWNCPRVAIPFPAIPPFDRHVALAAWKKCTRKVEHDRDWTACRIPVDMSEPEANFWLYALSEPWTTHSERRAADHSDTSYETSHKQAAIALEQLDLDVDHRDAIPRRLVQLARAPAELAGVLARLLGAEALADFILDDRNADARWRTLEAERSEAEYRDRLDRQPRGYGVTGFIIDGAPVSISFTLPDPPPPAVTERPHFDPGSLLDIASRSGCGGWYASVMWGLACGFARYVAPYVSDATAAAIASRLPTSLAFPAAGTHGVSIRGSHRTREIAPAVMLAASLHAHDIVLATLTEQPKPYHQDLDLLAFGSGNSETAKHFWDALEVTWTQPAMVREWLALTDGNDVAYAREHVARHAGDKNALEYLDALGCIVNPQTAAAMLKLTELPPLYVAARTWLEEHRAMSEPVLREHAGATGHCGETAREILARFARRPIAKHATNPATGSRR